MELNDYERYSAPSRKGPYFFFSKNSGLQNQSVLYIQKGLDGAPEVLLDPNAWSTDGTVQLSAFAPSKDADVRGLRDFAAAAPTGSSTRSWSSRRKRTLDDTIDWVKVSDVAWQGDGFYYSRYPEPAAGHEKASINENHQVFFHALGTKQSDDELVYEDASEPAALPHRRHDRGRALRDPRRLRARQRQGRQRALRARPHEAAAASSRR